MKLFSKQVEFALVQREELLELHCSVQRFRCGFFVRFKEPITQFRPNALSFSGKNDFAGQGLPGLYFMDLKRSFPGAISSTRFVARSKFDCEDPESRRH
jgi:hypothetical protein